MCVAPSPAPTIPMQQCVQRRLRQEQLLATSCKAKSRIRLELTIENLSEWTLLLQFVELCSYQHVGNIWRSRALPAWLVTGCHRLWQFDGKKRRKYWQYEESIMDTYINSTSKIQRIRLGAITNNCICLLSSHLSYTCKWSIPTCRFERHQLVDSINALVSYWSTTTFRQPRPLTLNWPFEKSIATKVIHKLSICKIHREQFNTRLLVENSTCTLIIRTKLELVS